ncbi:hypothetical protein DFH09DRAFT_1144248, partial [Mycena vulgaris]
MHNPPPPHRSSPHAPAAAPAAAGAPEGTLERMLAKPFVGGDGMRVVGLGMRVRGGEVSMNMRVVHEDVLVPGIRGRGDGMRVVRKPVAALRTHTHKAVGVLCDGMRMVGENINVVMLLAGAGLRAVRRTVLEAGGLYTKALSRSCAARAGGRYTSAECGSYDIMIWAARCAPAWETARVSMAAMTCGLYTSAAAPACARAPPTKPSARVYG